MTVRAFVAALLALLGVLGLASTAAFADERRSSVSGTVWFDSNANGRPDSGERAVRNIQIDLEGSNYRESRKTGDNGGYEFTGLAAGRYSLSIKLPNGYGLSAGANQDLMILDGLTAFVHVDFGIARADQLPSPTAAPTQVVVQPTSTPPPRVAPASPAYSPPVAPPTPPPAAAPVSQAARPAAPSAPPPATATTAPTSTPLPEPTRPRAVDPTLGPPATPTRTPPVLETQQLAAERARLALESPSPARTGSSTVADDVQLDVPFRSALDGSDYAETNSGSAALGMVLEAYGYRASTADLRALANTLGRSYDVSQPPRLEVLARVAELPGLRAIGLFQGLRAAIWTADDVRQRLKAGYPVLTQLRPNDASGEGELGRERFVVVVGLKEGGFIYHDPAFPDARGAGRWLVAADLTRAWANGPTPAQAAAFGLGRAELSLFASPEQLAQAQQQPDTYTDARQVPSPADQEAAGDRPLLGESPQLAAVGPADQARSGPPADAALPPWSLPIHPLFLSFWIVAGLVFVRILAGLLFD